MRGSSQFLRGGFVLLAVGLGLYVAFVLLPAAGGLAPFTMAPTGLFVLVAVLFFSLA